MKRFLLCAMSVMLAVSVAWSAFGQCPGGVCPPRGWQPAQSVDVQVKVKPTPAWRYERAVKHRTAVVRVFCNDGGRVRSIGSGVLVRWGKRIVVLTARHVIQDAKSVVVQVFTRKAYRARIIKVDATWDCAVLELSEQPKDVEPAEVELGKAAMFTDGDRLESCGYGPDGRLASNAGLFKGYRRSTAKKNGPDDWMVVSGHARGGDSGGPVFNSRGRVVGVIWGTDGETVVCVQAGRIHVLLDAATTAYQQQAVNVGIFQRNPTPPKPAPDFMPQRPLVPVPPQGSGCAGGSCPGGQCDPAAFGNKAPMLPWRGEAEARDSDFENRLNGLLAAQEAERQARMAGEARGPSVDVQVGPKPEVPAETAPAPKPIGVVLCLVGALVVGVVVFYNVQKN